MLQLVNIYLIFFKLGLFGFGGGYVILPLLFQQIEITGLIPTAEFPDILALSQMTPGPIVINAATYIGFRSNGIIGSVVATLGVLTPSMVLVILLVSIMNRCKGSLLVTCIIQGVRPVTVGMIFTAALYFLEITVFNGQILSSDVTKMGTDFINLLPAGLFTLVLILAMKTRINPIFLSVGAGITGMFFF